MSRDEHLLRQERAMLQNQLKRAERENPNSKISKNRAANKVARKARKKNRK